MSGDENEKVGYGNPPRHSRFKKGQSGNPKGRKKGNRNFNTDLEEVLTTRVSIRENGISRKVTSQQALLRRLLEKAMSGDSRALERILLLGQQLSEDRDGQSAGNSLSKIEEDILQRYEADLLARFSETGRDCGAQGRGVGLGDDGFYVVGGEFDLHRSAPRSSFLMSRNCRMQLVLWWERSGKVLWVSGSR